MHIIRIIRYDKIKTTLIFWQIRVFNQNFLFTYIYIYVYKVQIIISITYFLNSKRIITLNFKFEANYNFKNTFIFNF